jgi:hypothetical protein
MVLRKGVPEEGLSKSRIGVCRWTVCQPKWMEEANEPGHPCSSGAGPRAG